MGVNTLKGEVSFVVDGETFTLAFPINTLIEMESHYEGGFDEVAQTLLSGGLKLPEVRTLFRFALLAKHGPMTDEAAGEVMGRIGTFDALGQLGLAVISAYPKAEEAAAAGPRNRTGAGTGKPPSASGASSASATPTASAN